MNLSERKKEILRAVVEQYVETAEPVGSKAIASEIGFSISPATVRNEMAELEALGLLEQPHTSAGRVPSPLGYRLYVNELMRRHDLSRDDAQAIQHALGGDAARPSRLLDEAGKVTSQLTTYPAYALAPTGSAVCIRRFDLIHVDINTFIIVALLSNDAVKNKLVRVTVPVEQAYLIKLATVFNASFTGITEERITPSLISSTERALNDTSGVVAAIAGFTIELLCESKAAEAHVAGAVNIFDHPEYRDIDKAQRLIKYLSDDKELVRLPSPDTVGDMKITIGPENLAEELRDSSVVVARYDAGSDMQGIIGVVGPTRMDYGKVAARLSYIAHGLSLLLSGSESPPGIDNDKSKLGVDDIGKDER